MIRSTPRARNANIEIGTHFGEWYDFGRSDLGVYLPLGALACLAAFSFLDDLDKILGH